MSKESIIYKNTLLDKREWCLFFTLTFSLFFTKIIEVYMIKYFYTSTILSRLTVKFIDSSGNLIFIYFSGMILCFFVNLYCFSQYYSNKRRQLKLNIIITLILFVLYVLSILFEDGTLNFKLLIYICSVLFLGLSIHFLLAYFNFKLLEKDELESLQLENIKIWINENYGTVLIIIICTFFGLGIFELSMNDVYIWSETEKILSNDNRIYLESDQYDFYLITIFICYFRLIIGRIKVNLFTVQNLIFLVLFFILIGSVHYVIFQLSLIKSYDFHLFPKNNYITIQKEFFFSYHEYIIYLDELGSSFMYQFVFVIIIVLKDKFDFVSNQKRLEVIKQKDLENALLKARIDTINNQINPHFIFNTLNFISAKSNTYSKELGNAVDTLSNILRYSLTGYSKLDNEANLSNTNKDLTELLKDEINHLKNYIEIHRMRYDGNIFVDLHIDGNPSVKAILPLTLINYVENAFKYGEVNDSSNPLIIRIKISGNQLNFYIKNKKSFRNVNSNKRGNILTQERLDLAYTNRYELSIVDDKYFYSVSLNITL